MCQSTNWEHPYYSNVTVNNYFVQQRGGQGDVVIYMCLINTCNKYLLEIKILYAINILKHKPRFGFIISRFSLEESYFINGSYDFCALFF